MDQPKTGQYNNLPANANSAGQNDGRKALDAEILEPDSGPAGENGQDFRNGYGGDGQARYRRFYYQSSASGMWPGSALDKSGCMAPAITFALFLICGAQFGVLAALGFAVFHTIGNIMGAVRAARMLAMGLPANPWAWKTGNWVVSFLIAAWLAGGFD